ncbi:polymer-forming cytoskeletal protein [bacterium]|nr:polymer-forming cytoskeletal protein [bacterium]
MAKENENQSGTNLNLIGRGTVIVGAITASSSIRIEGEIKGKVVCHDLVTVGSTGNVEGDIDAKNIVIGGKVSGNISAQDKLVMEAKSGVMGDLRARRLVVDEGATFDGKCSMKAAKDKPLIISDNPSAGEMKIVKG